VNHLPLLPILVPFCGGIAALLLARRGGQWDRIASAIATVAVAALGAAALFAASDGQTRVYRLGDWAAPYGIVLVLDRLSAMLLATTATLAVPALLAALSGIDRQGRHFHAFFQFQVAGINGAFLTGDLFNLFVFFEILLLASYGLLAHGGGVRRTGRALAYVILNLVGSAVFLIALGLVYGLAGTLNIADLGVVLQSAAPAQHAPLRATIALLATVFLLKSAVMPVGLWLPGVYASACVPAAILFAVLTKVGIYALLRVMTVPLAAAPATADLFDPWLVWLAVATILFGSVGTLAARSLSTVVANLVLLSAGTLLAVIAHADAQSIAAALYYLPHTTLVSGAMFLLVAEIARARGNAGDTLVRGPAPRARTALGVCFLALAVAASGMPPLSGFLGKVMILQAVGGSSAGFAIWAAMLSSGLIVALVAARAGGIVFWEPAGFADMPSQSVGPPSRAIVAALSVAMCLVATLTIAAAPLSAYATATAAQILDRASYVAAVLGDPAQIQRERRP
jgi:multicomponent K+:H+ antiporter subunit D